MTELLDINPDYEKYVNKQIYFSFCSLTKSSFPFSHREGMESEIFSIKFNGCYENDQQFHEHAAKLQKMFKNHDIVCGEIGKLYPFDLENEKQSKNTEYIYHDEKLGKCLNINEGHKEIYENKKEDKDENKLDKTVTKQNWVCVTFFESKNIKGKIRDNFEQQLSKEQLEKPIFAFIVHGFFEKQADAQKHGKMLSLKPNSIVSLGATFVLKVGTPVPVFYDIIKNGNESLVELRDKLHIEYITKYNQCLEKVALEERERKEATLQGAEVVTGKYDQYIDSNSQSTLQTENNDETVNVISKETEEERLERQLREIEEKQQELNRRLESCENIDLNDEFESKLQDLLQLHDELTK